MSARLLSGAALGLFLAAVAPGVAQDTAPASPVPAAALPESPAELFATLSKDIRPQWRALFRQAIPRTAGDRFKTALALGAVCADCYLAAEARDAQQIRNLLTDMASLEMTLGIARQMSSHRQELTDLADAGDWPGVRREVTAIMTHHRQFLGDQKDESLAELERTGCWLRAFHICARFASRQPKPPAQPCIWSPAFLTDLHTRTGKAAAGIGSPALNTVNAGLLSLTKTWPDETTPANAPSRLAATLKLLDSLMAELIDDLPAGSPNASPNTQP